MRRPTRTARFSANGLFGIFFLVMVVGGMPIVVKHAFAAGQALTSMVR